MRKLLIVAMALAFGTTAYAETCPVLHGELQEDAKIGKFRRGKKLEAWIEYLDTSGHTAVDAKGIHYHVFGMVIDGGLFYPAKYFRDDYPLYLIGHNMRVRVHVTNHGKRVITNLRVGIVQEYLNIFGGDGENLPGNSTSQFFIERLKRNQEWVGEATITIPGGTMPGLDQTHLVVSRCLNYKKNCCSKQRLLVNLPQAGLYCPP